MVARIGESSWNRVRQDGQKQHRRIGGVANDRYPVEDQSAYDLDEATVAGDYLAGDSIFTVPFESYRARPLPRDVVIVEREENGFVSYSLYRTIRTDAEPLLEAMMAYDDPTPIGPQAVKIVGLVIGFFRPTPAP